MALFEKNGHISDQGFFILIEKEADELQRLELSEHLSFCEDCLKQYLQYLEQMPQCLEEAPSIRQDVFAKVRKKSGTKIHHRLTTVVAACIAMVLWSSGVFHWGSALCKHHPAEHMVHQMGQITEQANQMSSLLYKGYENLLNKIDWRGDMNYETK